jgi:predicted dehydrogenase
MDAVAIFTPVPLHAWMIVEALRAGKNVISAVITAMTEEQLVEVLDTVRATGHKYMMAETSYYRPEIITCRQWSREGKFGTIFYSEAEYHHEGLIALARDDRGLPTWRYGFPPAHYCTHSTGMVVPVTGERLSEVSAIGWGDGHEILKTNQYKNPFWNATCFFKTSGGHAARISLCRHIAAGGTERGVFFGDRMTYTMARPEGSPNTVSRIEKAGKTTIDSNGYPEGDVKVQAYNQPDHWQTLPESLRVKSGHGGSHVFLVHEFVRSIVEDRHPAVNIWEAIAYTLPGIVAHQSALRGGELMKIHDYGTAPA